MELKQEFFKLELKEVWEILLESLKEANTLYPIQLVSLVLMNNHYHLLLEDSDGNLSKIMHHINRNYVEIYNKSKGCDGSLFKGRFKAVLVDRDQYLLELTRYIHRNPIKLVKDLKDYRWSSYRCYLGLAPKPIACLEKNKSMEMLGCQDKISEYELFVNSEKGRGLYGNRKNLPSILGGAEFKKKVFIKK